MPTIQNQYNTASYTSTRQQAPEVSYTSNYGGVVLTQRYLNELNRNLLYRTFRESSPLEGEATSLPVQQVRYDESTIREMAGQWSNPNYPPYSPMDTVMRYESQLIEESKPEKSRFAKAMEEIDKLSGGN